MKILKVESRYRSLNVINVLAKLGRENPKPGCQNSSEFIGKMSMSK